MSMYIEFDAHSWYMGFAIKHDPEYNDPCEFTYNTDSKNCIVHDQKVHPSSACCEDYATEWSAHTDDGNTYRIVTLRGATLAELKQKIREPHLCKHNGYGERIAARRLEQLRGELQAERISYSELAELWKLHEYIKPGDVELLQAAGVPEN